MRLKGERSAHLGGDGGKNASLEPNLWEEHPWEQKRQPTMDEVRQCVFGGHPSHAHTLIDFSRVVSIDVFRPCFGFLLFVLVSFSTPRGRGTAAKRWPSRGVDHVRVTHDALAELQDGTRLFDVVTLKGRDRLVKV